MNTLPLPEAEEITPNQWAQSLMNQIENSPAVVKEWNQPPKRECVVYEWPEDEVR